MLEIKDLHCQVEETKILNGVNLTVEPGKIHVLMGQNGSGKSTLSKALTGHPNYEITSGEILLDGESITESEPNERSKHGLFMAFQYPVEVPGVNFSDFLRLAYNARLTEDEQIPVFKFRKILKEAAKELGFNEQLLDRSLNEGLSGGEKKKAEILQMAVLDPKYTILDETDSGLDLDALKVVFEGINKIISTHGKMGVLIITHYQRIFDYIQPDKIHVMHKGRIVEEGGMELVEKINKKGYAGYQ